MNGREAALTDTERCRAVYREMYRAMIARDIPALERLLDDGFVLVHMTGMRQPKAAFLRAVADGTLNYSACEDDQIDVEVRGDSAKLTGRSRVNAAVFGGGFHTWRLRQDLALLRRDGTWKIAHSVASTY